MRFLIQATKTHQQMIKQTTFIVNCGKIGQLIFKPGVQEKFIFIPTKGCSPNATPLNMASVNWGFPLALPGGPNVDWFSSSSGFLNTWTGLNFLGNWGGGKSFFCIKGVEDSLKPSNILPT